MSELLKKPYKISLWSEEPTFLILNEGADEDERYESTSLPTTGNYTILNQYIKEYCLATIGSNTMDTPIKAFDPKLTQKLNGINELTFQIYYKYLDEESGEYKSNPFIQFLVNERKVKLFYNSKWYDFVIKEVQENSSNYTYTYSCRDLHINELSKTGYEVELETDLRNNQGTVVELAEKILKDSDWKVGLDNDIIKEKKKEVLYTYQLEEGITGTCMDYFQYGNEIVEKGEIISIPKDATIFICYSSITNKEPFIQFFYAPPKEGTEDIGADYVIDPTDGVILNSPNWKVEVDDTFFDKTLKVTTSMFGEKLVSNQKSRYVAEIDEYCTVYTRGSDPTEYYSFYKTTHSSVTEIQNLLSNSNNFVNANGWTSNSQKMIQSGYQEIDGELRGALEVNFGTNGGEVSNSGVYDNRKATKGFIAGEKYVFAIHFVPDNGNLSTIVGAKITGKLLSSTPNTAAVTFFNFKEIPTEEIPTEKPPSLSKYKVFEATCLKNLSYTDMLTYDLNFDISGKGIINIVDAKLFKKLMDKNDSLVVPDLEDSLNTVVKLKHYFFKASLVDGRAYQLIYSKDDLVYDAVGYEEEISALTSKFKPVYSENYQKIRSITGAKSNRFNLIQQLCETFECWADFEIEHDKNSGSILSIYKKSVDVSPKEGKTYYSQILNEKATPDENYQIVVLGAEDVPSDYYEKEYGKTVVFKEYIGEENDVGFRYGINLKSIKRDIKSEAITTKMIVEPNSNKFAENGSCTIQTAILNPTGENTLYNFDYYIKQGLIDMDDFYEDLYGEGLGIYPKLRGWNNEINPLIVELSLIERDLDKLISDQVVLTNQISAAESKVMETTEEIAKAEGFIAEKTRLVMAGKDVGRLRITVDGETASWKIKDLQHPFDERYYLSAGVSSTAVERESSLSSLAILGKKTDASETNTSIKEASGSFSIEDLSSGEHYVYAYGQTIGDGKCWPAGSGSIIVSETENKTNDYLEDLKRKREIHLSTIDSASGKLVINTRLLEEYKVRQKAVRRFLQDTYEKKSFLTREFYKKYSRFIQEGIWSSEDYFDSDLYYLDAHMTMYTSAFPQVVYTIDVIEISELEGFEPYKFKIGDKTYMEDTEFFGWEKNGRPYQEEIVVSEVSYSLDDPSKNSIKVQNYKTQFEELFQRIAAAAQSLQYSEGKYKRAAGAINADGTINSSLLENSMLNNSLIIQNAKNESVTWDETGITITNSLSANEIVRLVSGGIVLTSDGGKKWTTGITGDGINANVITTGQLDTDLIRIFAGGAPSFEWDGVNGISAYMFTSKDGYPLDIPDRSKFVRFNKFGLFGFSGDSASVDFDTLNSVIEHSDFSLTWKGLKINVQGKTDKDEVINVNDKFTVFGDGSVRLSGSITWNENEQVKQQYATAPDAAEEDWIFDSDPLYNETYIYRRDSFDGGNTYGTAYQFRGLNGQMLHIKYSDDGGESFTTNNEVGKYIGILRNDSEEPSSVPADYEWSLLKGDNICVKYAKHIGNNQELIPEITPDEGNYLGVASTINDTCPTTFGAYQWILVKGEDGNTPRIWMMYLDELPEDFKPGGVDLELVGDNSKPGENTRYIGISTTTTPTAPVLYKDYSWTRIKGDQGPAGTTPEINYEALAGTVEEVLGHYSITATEINDDGIRTPILQTAKIEGAHIVGGLIEAGTTTTLQLNGAVINGGSLNIGKIGNTDNTDNYNFTVDSSGNVKMLGGIDLSGNITWTKPPVQYQFSINGIDGWHPDMEAADMYRQDSLDGGEHWGDPYQFRGTDGAEGANGAKGADGAKGDPGPQGPRGYTGATGTVDYTEVDTILASNYKITKGGSGSLTYPIINAGKFYGGELSVGVGAGSFVRMLGTGLNLYVDNTNSILGMGYRSAQTTGSYNLPYITFGIGIDGIGTDMGMIKKYGNGIWIGNNSNIDSAAPGGKGIFINFVDNTIEKYIGGLVTPLSAAVFS